MPILLKLLHTDVKTALILLVKQQQQQKNRPCGPFVNYFRKHSRKPRGVSGNVTW